jgi:uncharacterized protein YjbJ (UPF0337 family)
MDREHVKGAADKVKGAVMDTAGKVTGDEKMQAEGEMDKAKGAAHNAAGDAKDTARDALNLSHKQAACPAAFLLTVSGGSAATPWPPSTDRWSARRPPRRDTRHDCRATGCGANSNMSVIISRSTLPRVRRRLSLSTYSLASQSDTKYRSRIARPQWNGGSIPRRFFTHVHLWC